MFLWVLLGFLALVLAWSVYRRNYFLKNYKPKQQSSHLIELNQKNFREKTGQGLILIDFWAPWCSPCRVQGPIISELADHFKGEIAIAKMNIDENQQLARKLNIKSIPTLLIFKEGKMVQKMTGLKSKDYLVKTLNKLSK